MTELASTAAASILAHGLADEETALRIEAAVIDLLGLDDLTNAVRGWRSIELGRMSLEELIPYYAAKPVTIEDPVLLIRINQHYRHAMSARELYEATRGIWKLSPSHAEQASYAFAVFGRHSTRGLRNRQVAPSRHSEVRNAGSGPQLERSKRWEFEGRVAHDTVRTNYLGSSVSSYFPRGSQSPVRYVNC